MKSLITLIIFCLCMPYLKKAHAQRTRTPVVTVPSGLSASQLGSVEAQ
jgi:hypothetical protein